MVLLRSSDDGTCRTRGSFMPDSASARQIQHKYLPPYACQFPLSIPSITPTFATRGYRLHRSISCLASQVPSSIRPCRPNPSPSFYLSKIHRRCFVSGMNLESFILTSSLIQWPEQIPMQTFVILFRFRSWPLK